MLQNLTNFFNLITNRKIKTTLKNNDLIAVGTRDNTWAGNYQPTAITYSDLAAQIGGGGTSEILVNGILSNSIQIGPSSLVTVSGSSPNATITLKPEIPYKAYRAKLTASEIDWPGYGYLYNWFAVDDARGLANPDGGTGLTAPNEWRVPSDTDWDTLTTFAGGSSVAGGKLKSNLNGTPPTYYGWLGNGGGTDDYNFSGLPGGYRDNNGSFNNIGTNGYWWSSTEASTNVAWFRGLDYSLGSVVRLDYYKTNGMSVRLVREATAGELLLTDGDTSDTSSLDPYTGNDGKTYVTVKIDSQIWLAQNLRETKYNDNSDIINCSILGGNTSDGFWQARGSAQEGAWTVYTINGTEQLEYDPSLIELIYTTVLENSLGQGVNWQSTIDGINTVYRAQLASTRSWFPTHIKLTPGYDVSDYDNSISTLVQKNLIVKRAVTGENYIDFFPVKIDGNGTLTIEALNNYSDLLGSPDSTVYVEILEYQESYYYSSSLAAGMGVGNL
jgi:hypothetical protein